MKPILVSDCSSYSYDTNNCTKCGRSMPDMCIEFEDMKRKAEAYDKLNRDNSSSSDTPVPNKRADGLSISSESLDAAYEAAADELVEELKIAKETKPVDPYVQKAAARKPGRPKKRS